MRKWKWERWSKREKRAVRQKIKELSKDPACPPPGREGGTPWRAGARLWVGDRFHTLLQLDGRWVASLPRFDRSFISYWWLPGHPPHWGSCLSCRHSVYAARCPGLYNKANSDLEHWPDPFAPSEPKVYVPFSTGSHSIQIQLTQTCKSLKRHGFLWCRQQECSGNSPR